MERTLSNNTKTQTVDRERLSLLTHYICYKSHDPTKLGSTKLNKILCYSDLLAYMKNGRSITGETYVKGQFGPMPKHILGVIQDLESTGAIICKDADYFGYQKKEYIALKEPDISTFSPKEISIVDEVFDPIYHEHTAQSISEASHGAIYHLAEFGEEIPLYTAFASELGEITEEDVQWVQEALAAKNS